MRHIDSTATVSETTAREVGIYRHAVVRGSDLADGVTIGDFSRVEHCRLGENVEIQRGNHIYSTSVGRRTYTGHDCTIWNAAIGSFCSLSWNVSIGGVNTTTAA